MKKNIYPILTLITVFCCSSLQPTRAQQTQKIKYDSNYIVTYPEKFGIRILATQKYASLNMRSVADGDDIDYHANRKFTLGLGGTYKTVSLNVAAGVGYLTNDDKGKTKGLDIRIHFLPYKWQVDLLAGFHKGNYLSPKGYLSGSPDGYYYRPDVEMNLIGVGAYRVANPRRYSPAAALTQIFLQSKSAGSFMAQKRIMDY